MPTFLERLNSAHGGNLEDTIALCQLIVESKGRVKDLQGCVPEPLFYDLCLLFRCFGPAYYQLSPHVFVGCASGEMRLLIIGRRLVGVYEEVFNVYRR